MLFDLDLDATHVAPLLGHANATFTLSQASSTCSARSPGGELDVDVEVACGVAAEAREPLCGPPTKRHSRTHPWYRVFTPQPKCAKMRSPEG